MRGSDHRVFTYERGVGMKVLELQKEQRLHESKSVALALDAHVVITDVQPVQLIALDPRTGLDPSSIGPSMLVGLQMKTVNVLEPSVWTVQWNASVPQVSAAAPQTEPGGHLSLLAPVLMAAKGVLVALHPVTGAALWQLSLEGTPLSVLSYDLKRNAMHSSLTLEKDLVILCQAELGVSECDGLMIAEHHRHLIPSAAESLAGHTEPVFVMQAASKSQGLIAIPNPAVMIVDSPERMLRLPVASTAATNPALAAPQIRALDPSALSSKMVLRSELARNGVAGGRIPTKWGGSKAIETATASELKWALLRLLRKEWASKVAARLSGSTEMVPDRLSEQLPPHGVVPWQPHRASHLGLHWLQAPGPNTPQLRALAAPEVTEEAPEGWSSALLLCAAMSVLIASLMIGWWVSARGKPTGGARKRRKQRRGLPAELRTEAAGAQSVVGASVQAGRTERKDEGADRECVVCVDESALYCLYPCGHQCVCEECGQMLLQGGHVCPMCRFEIKDVVRVWAT
eukprot:TRINITY_DN4395_c0_g1_i5.p1 TRINITY_DN4395_c0_g1~~TRINITY_DN4395_c0_g1_i5.p1  ORF type:complete len:515 (-),score=99.07 TRINITY_DN4395_c0_g1_i5:211-1755(-)